MEYIEEDVICWKGQHTLYSFLWIFFSQDRTSGDLEIIFAFYTVFAGVAPHSGQGLSGGWESTFSTRWLLLPFPLPAITSTRRRLHVLLLNDIFSVCACDICGRYPSSPLPPGWEILSLLKEGSWKKIKLKSYKLHLTGVILFSYFDYWCFLKSWWFSLPLSICRLHM